MNKNTLITIIIFIIFGIVIWIYAKHSNFNPVDKDDLLLQKISELELKIDSLKNQKDSIRTAIDSTHIKIITNEKHYQERINTIITQPLSVDSQYISDYIGRYIESHKSYFQ
jgi:hypothetical protein